MTAHLHVIDGGADAAPRPTPTRTPNLRLCSSCEVGSHQLCTSRLGDGLWAPAFVCHCLCRLAERDPLMARYLDGDR